jgi:hypothetical protein
LPVRYAFAGAALLALLAPAASALPPPLPVDQLCALICGGLWLDDSGPEPYFFRFEKDERYGVIRGRSGPHGGKPAMPSDAMIVYGFDNNTLDFWAIESNKGHTPLMGKVELTGTGFSVTREDAAGKVIVTFGFPERDILIHRMTTESGGNSDTTSGILYRRIKE